MTILSKFNRLVSVETNPASWHSVSPATALVNRCCISNYYFSNLSPTGHDYFNVTSFSARPEQKVRRVIAALDNQHRKFMRYMHNDGLGKTALYKKP